MDIYIYLYYFLVQYKVSVLKMFIESCKEIIIIVICSQCDANVTMCLADKLSLSSSYLIGLSTQRTPKLALISKVSKLGTVLL